MKIHNKNTVTALGILALLIAAIYFLKFLSAFTDQQEEWSQFGDYFGGVLNPILSFAAFIAVLFSLEQQSKSHEVGSIRHHEVLSNNRFFELISLTHEAARAVEINEYSSHRAIAEGWYDLKRRINSSLVDASNYADFIDEYNNWREGNWRFLGSYFESVLFVLDRYVLDPRDKECDPVYFTLAIRSQMSVPERNILFYEMLRSEDWHKYMSVLDEREFWRGWAHKESHERKTMIRAAANFFNRRHSLIKALSEV